MKMLMILALLLTVGCSQKVEPKPGSKTEPAKQKRPLYPREVIGPDGQVWIQTGPKVIKSRERYEYDLRVKKAREKWWEERRAGQHMDEDPWD